MDYLYIEQLLQRYFDCETTTQEEAILRAFFSQDDIPEKLKGYSALFRTQSALGEERLSDGFEARIMQQIEGNAVQARRISLQSRFIPLYKAAAGVAIVLSLGLAAQRGMETHDSVVTARPARPAGEQVSVLPETPVTIGDTLLTVPQSQ